MKKVLSVLLIAVTMFLSACCVFNITRRPESKATMGEQLEQKTVAMVRYVANDEDGDVVPADENTKGAWLAPYCSGVWINRDTFVTAGHCVESAGKPEEQQLIETMLEKMRVPREQWRAFGIEPWNPVGQAMYYSARVDIKDTETRKFRGCHTGKVLAYDLDHDLALVRALHNSADELPDHDVAILARSARVGEEVHIVGHTIGLWWSYTHGYVAQNRLNFPNYYKKPMNTLQVSAPVYYGNSGGGAFNADGELVGVMSWIRTGPDLGFFVRYDEVEYMLRHEGISH